MQGVKHWWNKQSKDPQASHALTMVLLADAGKRINMIDARTRMVPPPGVSQARASMAFLPSSGLAKLRENHSVP
jgi:hypothetical protein